MLCPLSKQSSGHVGKPPISRLGRPPPPPPAPEASGNTPVACHRLCMRHGPLPGALGAQHRAGPKPFTRAGCACVVREAPAPSHGRRRRSDLPKPPWNVRFPPHGPTTPRDRAPGQYRRTTSPWTGLKCTQPDGRPQKPKDTVSGPGDSPLFFLRRAAGLTNKKGSAPSFRPFVSNAIRSSTRRAARIELKCQRMAASGCRLQYWWWWAVGSSASPTKACNSRERRRRQTRKTRPLLALLRLDHDPETSPTRPVFSSLWGVGACACAFLLHIEARHPSPRCCRLRLRRAPSACV